MANGPPQHLQVLVSDPRMSVQITALLLYWTHPPSEEIQLAWNTVNFPHSGYILITSNMQGVSPQTYFEGAPTPSYPIHRVYWPAGPPGRTHLYASIIDLGTVWHDTQRYDSQFPLRVHNSITLVATTFTIPSFIQETKGSTFAHLPAIEDEIPSLQAYGFPFWLAEHSSKSSQLSILAPVTQKRKVHLKQTNSYNMYSLNPRDYETSFNGQPIELFWAPHEVHIDEELIDTPPELRNAQVNSIVPTNGHFDGRNYVWHGEGSIEASASFTNPETADSLRNYDFFSGIAFGIVGAAAIALVQELPKKSPPAGSSGTIPYRNLRVRKPGRVSGRLRPLDSIWWLAAVPRRPAQRARLRTVGPARLGPHTSAWEFDGTRGVAPPISRCPRLVNLSAGYQQDHERGSYLRDRS